MHQKAQFNKEEAVKDMSKKPEKDDKSFDQDWDYIE